MTAQVWIAILVGLAATIDDLARRRIANWIPVAALAGGFGWQIGQQRMAGSAVCAGWRGGRVRGFSGFLSAGRNGRRRCEVDGWVRRAAGTERLLEAALWTAGVGGVLAVGVLGVKAARRWFDRGQTVQTVEERRQESIPYAPAITLGVWLSLVPKG